MTPQPHPGRRSHLWALALAGIVAATLFGCGSSEAGKAVEAYAAAVANKDARRSCELLTKKAREFVVRLSKKSSCEAGQEKGFRVAGKHTDRFRDAQVSEVNESGDTATATLTVAGQRVPVKLAKEGGEWRIAQLIRGG
jgi:ketosteroid isomerase-like protein